MKLSQDLIDRVKEKADIVQIISSYINVINKGNSYVSVCPFHNDKNPSLNISRSKQIFKCFSCGKSGNVFTFVSEYEHIPFTASVKKVADLVGIKDAQLDGEVRKIDPKIESTYKVLNSAKDIYKYALKSQDGVNAKKYLEERDISEEMQEYFSLGYSSSNSELPIKLLRNQGYNIEQIEQAGILVRNNGTFIDRFNSRVMFPIFNEFNNVVGFSGRRILDNSEAKYVNSPSTNVFNKSNILYNYQNAKLEARNEDKVYVVEGFMDVFALYKAGVKCSVALMGTAFTEGHAKLLKRLGNKIVLCLDGDDAGRHGCLKAGEVLESLNIDYSVVDYKDSKLDPDEILKTYGEKILAKFLNRIIDKFTFTFNYYKKINDLSTIEGRKNFAESLIPFISKVTSPIEKEILIKKVCKEADISIDTYSKLIKSDVKVEKLDFSKLNDNRVIKKKVNRLENLERECFYQILNSKEALNDFKSHGNNYFINEIYSKISYYAIELLETGNKYDVSSLIDVLHQSNDEKSNEMISLITDVISKSNQDKYDQEDMFSLLENLQNEISKCNENRKLINDLKNKNQLEQAQVLQTHIDSKKGGK